MGEEKPLKSGWQKVKFGDVVRLSKERSKNPEADGIEHYIGLEHIDPDNFKIRRWGLVSDALRYANTPYL